MQFSESRWEINNIRRLKRKLNQLLEESEDGKTLTFEEQVIMLEDWRKISIESKKITCVRFFTLREKYREVAYKSQIKQLMRQHG